MVFKLGKRINELCVQKGKLLYALQVEHTTNFCHDYSIEIEKIDAKVELLEELMREAYNEAIG